MRPGLLYLGTENRIYISFDDGARWQPLINNLPPAPMYGIVVQPQFNDLVIGTYGRAHSSRNKPRLRRSWPPLIR